MKALAVCTCPVLVTEAELSEDEDAPEESSLSAEVEEDADADGGSCCLTCLCFFFSLPAALFSWAVVLRLEEVECAASLRDEPCCVARRRSRSESRGALAPASRELRLLSGRGDCSRETWWRYHELWA